MKKCMIASALFVLAYSGYLTYIYVSALRYAQPYKAAIAFATSVAPIYCEVSNYSEITSAGKVLQGITDSIQGISDYFEQLDAICYQLNRLKGPLDTLQPVLQWAERQLHLTVPFNRESERFLNDLTELADVASSIPSTVNTATLACREGNIIDLSIQMYQLKSSWSDMDFDPLHAVHWDKKENTQNLAMLSSNDNHKLNYLWTNPAEHPMVIHLHTHLTQGFSTVKSQIEAYPFVPHQLLLNLVFYQMTPQGPSLQNPCISSILNTQ